MSALLNRSPLCRLQFIVCGVARRFVFGPAVARGMRNILYLCKSTRAKRAGSFGTWFKVPLYSVVYQNNFICMRRLSALVFVCLFLFSAPFPNNCWLLLWLFVFARAFSKQPCVGVCFCFRLVFISMESRLSHIRFVFH